VFRKCQACHSLEPGKNILGPSLAGIIGRKAGAEPGYSYSPALKQADIVWDGKTLDSYLVDPQKMVPGNKMPFPGLKTEHDRADVIAFLTPPTGSAQPAAAAPSAARQTRRRLRRQPGSNPPQQTKRGRARRTRTSVTSPTPSTHCARALPRAAWSMSASAEQSRGRSIRC
jgi:nitrite reductase (NO-forming)